MKVLSAAVAATAMFLSGLSPSMAADYPSRNMRIVVPFGAGGASDLVARALANTMMKMSGANIIIENRPGANGLVSLRELANAPADGYTLMIGNVATNAIMPLMSAKQLGVDYEKAFTPIARLTESPALVAVTAKNFAPKTLAEFVAYAKSNPGKLNYGSTGIGSIQHFNTALLAKHAGLDMTHIPVGGKISEMFTDLIRGDTHVISSLSLTIASPGLQSGDVRPLAVDTENRIPELPDVPTMKESGFPDVGSTQWQILMIRSDTPQEITQKLHDLVKRALAAPETLDAFKKAGTILLPSGTLADEKKWLSGELDKWRKNIADVGLAQN